MKKFETYAEALTAFFDSEGGAWQPATRRQSQLDYSLNTKMSSSAQYHRRLMGWFDAASNLQTPWPEEYMDQILRKKDGAYPEVFGWCKEENLLFLESLLGMGANPLAFVPSAYATLLGFAAYSENAEAVKLLLQYCQPPESRLLLTQPHLSANDNNLNSTLLHRICARSSSSLKMLNVVDYILEHDPDAILAQTQGGDTPHTGSCYMLKTAIEQKYNARQAQLQAERILEQIEPGGLEAHPRRKI